MLEHYALEDDPLEAFKQRQSRLEQVGAQTADGWGHHVSSQGRAPRAACLCSGCKTLTKDLVFHTTVL